MRFRHWAGGIAVGIAALGTIVSPASHPIAWAAPPPTAVPSTAPSAAPSSAPSTQPTSTANEPPPANDPKAEARAHFDKGKQLSQEGAWAAALAEFLASRELYATWGNTLGAASSLRKLGRFDEALDLFEVLLRDFTATLPPETRGAAQREIVDLRGLVGTIEVDGAEIGAAISIDGRSRGEYPAPSPLRVAAGTHVVRVSKQGFETAETRVDVAGSRTARVTAAMRPLTASGRLRVVEQSGATLEVLVDGVPAGQTPWEGVVGIGDHVVLLRGEGDLGTPPVSVSVKQNDTARLSLAAEELTTHLRVEPTPVNASVALDSVALGQGVWDGRVRSGKHKVEIAAPGFLPAVREVTIGDGGAEVVAVQLSRDPSSPFWRKPPPPPRWMIELAGGVPILPSFGGDISGGCGEGCSAPPGLGALVTLRAGYALSSGVTFGLGAGFVLVEQTLSGRALSIAPVGTEGTAAGTVDDTLAIRRGAHVGPFVGFTFGERVPVHLRVGAGPLFAWFSDTRRGTFSPVREGPDYTVGPITATTFVPFVLVSPEARVGYRVTDQFEVSIGVETWVLVALDRPAWNAKREVNAGADGIGTFPAERFMGDLLFGVAPGLAARYDFR